MKDNNSQSPTSTPKNDIFQKPRPVLKTYTAPKEVLEEITNFREGKSEQEEISRTLPSKKRPPYK